MRTSMKMVHLAREGQMNAGTKRRLAETSGATRGRWWGSQV